MEKTMNFGLLCISQENEQPALAFSLKNLHGHHRLSRDGVERLNAWLTQWLKENPEKVEGWLNVYNEGRSYFHKTKEDADQYYHATNPTNRIACIPISYTIGEGLNNED